MHKFTMKEKLINLNKNSKSVISGFSVSSILIDKNGNEYKGVNVEYAIPGNGICAERNAISNAFGLGMNFGDLREVHIFGMKKNSPDKDAFTPPCGLCRQAISEASNNKAKIFLYNINDAIKEYSIEELLPIPFTGEEL